MTPGENQFLLRSLCHSRSDLFRLRSDTFQAPIRYPNVAEIPGDALGEHKAVNRRIAIIALGQLEMAAGELGL